MWKSLALVCALVAHVGVAEADPIAPTLLQFGVPALTSATQEVDLAHYLYVPVIGPWLDIGRFGAAGHLVFDGLCQDFVSLAFVVRILAHHGAQTIAWRVLPWFPQSGGGGLSVKATF